MSTARKLILTALVIHFISLFFLYQDVAASGYTVPIWEYTGTTRYVPHMQPEQRGLEYKPYAFYVIIGLLIVFATNISQKRFWKRYGYWTTLVLLLAFAFGGAVIRTTGGNLSLVSIGLVILAALLNSREQKKMERLNP